MKIVIVGAGEIGRYLSQILSERGGDVTVIESNEQIAAQLDEELDVRVITGNGASAKYLSRAGVADCDYFLALTSQDQLNIMACSLARKLGARFTIARIHDQVYADNTIVNYQEYFGIDLLLNPEALAAVEFAKMMRNPERVAVEDFARGEIEMKKVEVSPEGRAVGRTLEDIRLPSGLRVAYVQRGGKMMLARADTKIETGDTVTVLGSPEAIFDNRRLFAGPSREGDIVVAISGATEIAASLLRRLTDSRFKLRVIEPNLNHARRMAEDFPKVTVINGSATSLRLLEEEHIGQADYFVACTRDDEENIMTCLQAKKLGVRHVMLAINKPDYEAVLGSMVDVMGLDMVVSARRTTASEVLRYVSDESYSKLGSLDDEHVDLIEVRVSPSSPAAGKPLAEIGLCPGCIVGALMHRNSAKVPGPLDVINADDRLVVVTPKDRRDEIAKLFTQK